MFQSIRVIQLAVSLGGVESLIEHPASMTHGDLFMSPEARKKGFITDGLLRMRYSIYQQNFELLFISSKLLLEQKKCLVIISNKPLSRISNLRVLQQQTLNSLVQWQFSLFVPNDSS